MTCEIGVMCNDNGKLAQENAQSDAKYVWEATCAKENNTLLMELGKQAFETCSTFQLWKLLF